MLVVGLWDGVEVGHVHRSVALPIVVIVEVVQCRFATLSLLLLDWRLTLILVILRWRLLLWCLGHRRPVSLLHRWPILPRPARS